MNDRRRNIIVLTTVVALLIGSLVVIFTKPTKLGLDLQGGVQLVYEARPTKQQPSRHCSGLRFKDYTSRRRDGVRCSSDGRPDD